MGLDFDFSKLQPVDALDLAIFVEQEAQERYDEFASQMELHHTPEAASFFRKMVEREQKHEAQIANRRRALFGDTPANYNRNIAFEVEAPDYDRARMFMPLHDALKVALDSEVKAHDYYDAALAYVSDATVRGLFEDLRAQELDHQRLIRHELAKLPADDGFDPADYADPAHEGY